TNTISLSGADAAAFEVEGTALYLKAGTSLDYEAKAAYAVTVSVSDATLSGSSPVSVDYNLAVTDVNNAYTFSIIDIPDDLASIKDSIAVTATRAIEYLSTYITWNGVLDFVVRFGGDPSWYQAGNGFVAYGGIESYTGSGQTFAQYEATTGIDLDSDWDVGTWVNPASFTNYGSPVYVDPSTVPDPYSDAIPDVYHDFFSIFLHESIHGLGMWSIAQNGGGSSSFFDWLTYEESGQYFFSGFNVRGVLDGDLPLATTGSRDHYSDELPPDYELIREFGYYENNRWQISNLDIAILLDLGFGLNQWIPVENGAATFQINGTVAVGNALSAVLRSDDPDGNGTGGFSYSWQTSTDGISWSEAGNTSSYHVADADQGKQLQLVVSYTDGEGFPESVTTAAGLVPLVNNGDASFTISGTASVGNTLSALLVANDPDGNPPAGYAHQWQSSGNGSSWVSISGATASSYLLSTSEGGKQIRVLVSYIDDQGFSEVVATAPVSVVESQNQPPTAVELTNVTATLAENTSTVSRIQVADIAISDDALGTNTISLLGADAAAFEVEGTVLYLKAGTSLDYETKAAYAVTVSVSDATLSGSSPVSTGYSLAVTDVNEAPTAVALTNTTASLPENTSTSSRIKVADIAISDDALGTNTISLLGA
ncbi:cadherin repeat domain-containing protein, partial [Microcystis elabens FACHB-917]|nr:cadherin repeat domain-containing protein [Microcystis elabens FACHB-917]